MDDGSQKFHSENSKINEFQFCKYEILKVNIGRSAIRNLLAKKAAFDNLLFLDSDTFPVDNNLIYNYLLQITEEEKIVTGGILYSKLKPQKSQILRWNYGNSREALSAEIRKKKSLFKTFDFEFYDKKIGL